MKSAKGIILASAVALVTLIPAVSFAHGSAEGIVKERMAMMKSMGDAMKALRPIMDQRPIDSAQALPLAEKIAQTLEHVPHMFPAGTDGGSSEALPEVWSKPQDFADANAANVKQAQALVGAIKSGDSEASLKAFARTAKACKDCHGDFKKAD